jgi:hypothetical protein
MKTPLVPTLFACLALVFSGCGKKDAPPGSTFDIKPARQTSFAEVTSQLDPEGSVYVYLATDQWLRGLSTNIAQFRGLLTTLPDVSGSDRENIGRVLDSVTRVIKKSGIENLNGVGISGVQVTPELHRTKFILHHGKGQGDGVLWNVMGKEPHALRGLDLLPQNTALASFGDLDAALLWKTIEEELRLSGVPELNEAVGRWPQTFEQQTKMSWSKLMASLGGEIGFILTLDDTKKIVLPLGQAVELPEPGLLIAVKVNDDLLYDRISGDLKKSGQAQMMDEKGLKMCAMRLPIPLPMDLQITVASSGGYFFLASSPAMVRNAIAVREGKQPGLRKSAEFEALMKYLPAQGNQFVYADRRLSATVLAVQKEVLNQQQAKEPQLKFLQSLLLKQRPTFGISISAHTATGWQSVSVGNQDSSSALVAAPAVAAVAVGAAMVLPALAKAKERAQSITCINNMKQIGLAFRIWEGDNNDQFPFNVSTEKGGTQQLSERNENGFDRMSYAHFQVMSNELNTPKILVCPSDSSKHAALDFANLQPENVSYLVRSGKEVNDANPEAVLTYCPIHHHVGHADGSVEAGKKEEPVSF